MRKLLPRFCDTYYKPKTRLYVAIIKFSTLSSSIAQPLCARFVTINTTILRQIKSPQRPFIAALFLPVALLASGFAETGSFSGPHIGVLGGPSATSTFAETAYSTGENFALLESSYPAGGYAENFVEEQNVFEIISESGIISSGRKPVGKSSVRPVAAKDAENPVLEGYFAMPTKGFNWGELHPMNAVDIANACGTPISASAAGLVYEASLGSWNDGYGHYVLVSHPNGTKTRYAHMEKISVSTGQYVKEGELLGTMGRTGDATGCHVHFEVIGAVNPFAK